MTNEDKQLLIKDLCARLPYGVRLHIVPDSDFSSNFEPSDESLSLELLEKYGQWSIYHPFIMLPYLRPLSSITEEEKEEASEAIEIELKALQGPSGFTVENAASYTFMIDFYNKHHLDYRGLIEKGFALEAPEGMYKTE